MKRVLSAIAIFVLFIYGVFGLDVNFFTPNSLDVTIQQNIQVNYFGDSKEKGVSLSTIVDFDMQELFVNFGTNYSDGDFDFTTKLRYSPTLADKLKLGTELTYHLFNYPDCFVEQDLLIDLFLRWNATDFFQLDFASGLQKKYTIVHAIKEIIPYFDDTSMDLRFILSFYPSSAWKLYCGFTSISYFNYPLFFTAFTTTGAEYKFDEHLSVGLDVSLKWYDFVVVAKNVGQGNFTLYGRYKI